MPLYSYQCSKCNKVVELLRKISNRNESPTCDCGASTTRLLAASFSPRVWDSDKEFYNFDIHPTRFKTKDDMRQRCRLDGIECGQLL